MRASLTKLIWSGILAALLAVGAGISVAAAATPPDDGTVTIWVLQALQADPRIDAADIEVVSQDGVVTLTGQVGSLTDRRLAEMETEKIDGVKGVIDELAVAAPLRDDDAIRKDVRQRLDKDSMLPSAGKVEVQVTGGVVDLTGTVASRAERDEAVMISGEVRGVDKVVDDLKVTAPAKRSDDAIASDARGALEHDVFLSEAPVRAKVDKGVVTLSGEVGNAYQRRRAEHDVWSLPGVRDVVDDVEVVGSEDMGVRGTPPLHTDGMLEGTIREVLARDRRLPDEGITVKVQERSASLQGEVPTYRQKEIAGDDARNVPGVARVVNDLQVSDTGLPDATIAEAVTAMLDSDYALADADVDVSVKDGFVTLTGKVDDMWKKAHARELAMRVAGTRGVTDEIQVAGQQPVADDVLVARVTKRLQHNAETAPIADRVQVRANDGKVTLTGKVDTWTEREAASRVTFLTGGVWAVDSRLQVKGQDENWETYSYRWPVSREGGVEYPDFAYEFFQSTW